MKLSPVCLHPALQLQSGVLSVDDTALDKPNARKIELATWHGRGPVR